MILDLINSRREEQLLRAIFLGLGGYYATKTAAPAARKSRAAKSRPRQGSRRPDVT
jgi:hypothetical protein